jgi:hypothetical protein
MAVSPRPLTNLKVIRRATRGAQEAGTVLIMQLPNEMYLFGRVIIADAQRPVGPTPMANLLYIYAAQSAIKQPPYSQMTPQGLLIPPVWTNRMGWSKGYFENVDHQALGGDDLLLQHCFKHPYWGPVDERGNKLRNVREPYGIWGLVSYRRLDDLISDAVGLPRVPDDA